MANIIEESFNLNIAIFSFLGLYPSKTHPTFQKVKGYVLYVCLLVLNTTLIFINLFCEQDSDSMQANFMVIFLSETIPICFKLAPFVTNGQEIEKCINYFAHPRFAPRDEEEKRIAEDCVYVCRRNSFIAFTILASAEFCCILTPLLAKGYQLPVSLWLPYDSTAAPVRFYFTFVLISIACLYDGFAGPMVDPLIGGLAYHATSQLKILKYNLQNLSEHVDRTQKFKISFESVRDILQRCVNHHNDILKFIAEYENCFSWSVFCQIAGCAFSICFACIGLTLASSTTFSTVKMVVYLFVFNSQILFYCYYGTLLFEENNGFMDAIYMGPWYEYDIKTRNILILMMERSKRPMILTAGKIVNVTIRTFTSLLKTSYSMIAVMKNFQ